MKARKSVFVPKKAELKAKRDIDISGADMKRAGNSDDEDEINSQVSGQNMSQSGSRYNLLSYNRERKIRLNEFDYTMDRGDTEEDDDFEQ